MKAETENREQIDIEMQIDTGAPMEQRSVHNVSTLVVHSLKPAANDKVAKEDLKNIPHSIVIFFMMHDHFRQGLPIYKFEMYSKEVARALKGTPTVVFVNLKSTKASGELAKLLHDITEKDETLLQIREIQDRMTELAMDAEARNKMNGIVQELEDRANKEKNRADKEKNRADKAEAEAANAKAMVSEITKALLARGFSSVEISELAGIPMDLPAEQDQSKR